MGEVARTRTALTERQVADALREAYQELFAEDPSLEVLGVGWSQIALENAHGGAVYNYNFGNITTQGGGTYYTLRTDEQISPGVWKNLELKYAAHDSPVEGARAYWNLIRGGRYAPAFELFRAGAAHDAAMKLHELGYFTANPEPIAKTFGSLYEHFVTDLAPGMGLRSGGQRRWGRSVLVVGSLLAAGAIYARKRAGESALPASVGRAWRRIA